jgi:hypothetical protein
MEKFKIYSDDPYDFKDLKQIEDFYNVIGKKEVSKKITPENQDKIYLRVLIEKSENTVFVTLNQDRSKDVAKIKLQDLVLDDMEFSMEEAQKFLDLSEYIELL